MIVEPTSLHSRSPLRRLLRSAAFVTPVILFTAIAAAGLLGQKPATDALDASASPPDVPTAVASDAADPPAAAASPTSPIADADFPAAYLSLAALRPSEVLAVRASPEGPPEVLAVAGYLEVAGATNRCAAPSVTVGPWCDRLGTLAETPWDGQGPRPAHLHVTVAAGVVLPPALEAADGTGRGLWAPVLAIGRFATPGSCAGDEQGCEHGFVVERVVWVDGMATAVAPLREPGQAAAHPAVPGQAEGSATLLLAVLARPATIATLDPAAAVAASRLQPRTGLVWYIRELAGIDRDAPTVRWALLDAGHSTRLASGPSASPPVAVVPTASAGAPVISALPSVTGLPSLTVPPSFDPPPSFPAPQG